MNIIESAIKMKKETQAHYEEFVKCAEEPGIKQLFSLLARAEKKHIEELDSLREKLVSDNFKELMDLEQHVCAFSPHINPRQMAEELSHDHDAYRHVIKEEVDTIEFFDQLGKQAENEQLKKICHLQADKEREHLNMLENIYFFVEEPRTYLEWGEFSNLKSL